MSTAQRYASAAYKDGLSQSTIESLASLACWGKHMQNCERDLHRWMPYAYNTPLETHNAVIEIYNPDSATIEFREIPILLASDVLHALWDKKSGVLWDECIGATPEGCLEYWTIAEREWAVNHPVVQFFGCNLQQHFYGSSFCWAKGCDQINPTLPSSNVLGAQATAARCHLSRALEWRWNKHPFPKLTFAGSSFDAVLIVPAHG